MDRNIATAIILIMISIWLYNVGSQPSTAGVAVASEPLDVEMSNIAPVPRESHLGSPALGEGHIKCPYTSTMEYPPESSFYSTGSPFWSSQYGGMHLGVDFVGNRGDPVFAPFDMIIDSVGFYDDPGRYGSNIQARFVKDNYLYYAGHLVDVFVSPGDVIPACTTIATLGATDQPHVHIKIAHPDAPVPCEGMPPGEGGCIDPISYWNESPYHNR